jgi:hypothetical protein
MANEEGCTCGNGAGDACICGDFSNDLVCQEEQATFTQCKKPVFNIECYKLYLASNPVIINGELNALQCAIDEIKDLNVPGGNLTHVAVAGVRIKISTLKPYKPSASACSEKQSCGTPFNLEDLPSSNSSLTISRGCFSAVLSLFERNATLTYPGVQHIGRNIVVLTYLVPAADLESILASSCDASFKLIFDKLHIADVVNCSRLCDPYIRADLSLVVYDEVTDINTPDADPVYSLAQCVPIEWCPPPPPQ